jgi:hypothetical protein
MLNSPMKFVPVKYPANNTLEEGLRGPDTSPRPGQPFYIPRNYKITESVQNADHSGPSNAC